MLKSIIKKYLPKRLLASVQQYKIRKEKAKAKKTFSQSGEDLIIAMWFNIIGVKNPTYLDIGAYHPFFINNTALLYEQGSYGINIEPNPEGFNEFVRVRRRDINLNIGVSSQKSELLYYFMSDNTLNTFSELEARQYAQQSIAQIQSSKAIAVDTIENVLKQYFDGKFPDLLSLDVEGLDEEILKSIHFDKYFPKIICVEIFNFSTQSVSSSLINFLESKEYKMVAFTGINGIFLKKELYPYK